MKSEIIGNHLVYNSKVLGVSEAGMLTSGSYKNIYEVVRVQSGVPLFLEMHMERLENSARLMNCSIKTIADKVQDSIVELIKVNKIPNKNIKITVSNIDNAIPDYMAYFVQSSYPTCEEYNNGVLGILFKGERDNPNAKVVNSDFRERIAAALADAKAYEALLINKNDEITEGSRSNIFFINNGIVLTAPKSNVLIGITRTCIFELCKNLGIEIAEMTISVSMLRKMEGAFITGTSPKILPISSIDNISYNSAGNPIIKMLMKGYDDMIAEYIRKNRV